MTQTQILRRPTTLAEMQQIDKRMETADGKDAWKSFQPRPTDLFITPYGKSGTTWLQQIVHGLRTGGDLDFDDISRVVPWLEAAHDIGIDLEAPQRAQPRAFKSHLSWHEIPKGARYLVSIRDPKDVLVSGYRFMEGWFFAPGTISMVEWARDGFLKRNEPGYWHHLASWLEQRHDASVFLLCYEQMQADLPGTVRAIAEFIGVTLDARLMEIVLRQSSFAFMLAHKDKFDDFLMRERSEKIGGLPPGSDSAKVRKGEVGAHRYELPAEISAELDQIWQEEITVKFGFPTYQALQATFRTA